MSSPPNNNSDVAAISLKDSSGSYSPRSKLYCNLCSCNLTLLDPKEEEWFCQRCGLSYYPNKGEKVKRANKFETPGPTTDRYGNITGEKGPIVSMIDDSATSVRFSRNKFPKSLEYLQRTGVNTTSVRSSVDDEGV
jgi:hypothetical protein